MITVCGSSKLQETMAASGSQNDCCPANNGYAAQSSTADSRIKFKAPPPHACVIKLKVKFKAPPARIQYPMKAPPAHIQDPAGPPPCKAFPKMEQSTLKAVPKPPVPITPAKKAEENDPGHDVHAKPHLILPLFVKGHNHCHPAPSSLDEASGKAAAPQRHDTVTRGPRNRRNHGTRK